MSRDTGACDAGHSAAPRESFFTRRKRRGGEKPYFLARPRMYATSEEMSATLSLSLYAGILPLPSLITFCRSASDCFCTSAERRSRTFIALPTAVAPAPSGPWQLAHFALKISGAPGAAANANVAVSMRSVTIDAMVSFRVIRISFVEAATVTQTAAAVAAAAHKGT